MDDLLDFVKDKYSLDYDDMERSHFKESALSSVESASKYAKIIENKIVETKGFWIFKVHAYSKDELNNDPIISQIRKLCERNNDHFGKLKESGSLSNSDAIYYTRAQNAIDEIILRIYDSINERSPTWWEQVKDIAVAVFEFIVDNLPPRIVHLFS